MKPRIFLSHNKLDKEFIVKLSEILRISRIDCWYDEWEIPPGESIRKKIFEEGLPSCDVFLVYLTENSIQSYWVQKELDSMMIIESDRKDNLLLPFINKNELRAKLSSDLRSKNIPELNNENFIEPVCKLISRTWEVFLNRELNKQKEVAQSSQTLLRTQILELENQILQIQLAGSIDIKEIRKQLQAIQFTFNETKSTLEQIFKEISILLGDGTGKYDIINKLIFDFKYPGALGFSNAREELQNKISEILGRLVVIGLVNKISSTSEYVSEEYNLTPIGVKVANQLMFENN